MKITRNYPTETHRIWIDKRNALVFWYFKGALKGTADCIILELTDSSLTQSLLLSSTSFIAETNTLILTQPLTIYFLLKDSKSLLSKKLFIYNHLTLATLVGSANARPNFSDNVPSLSKSSLNVAFLKLLNLK